MRFRPNNPVTDDPEENEDEEGETQFVSAEFSVVTDRPVARGRQSDIGAFDCGSNSSWPLSVTVIRYPA